LKTFADEADKGFILLTLGSLIKVSSMPEKTLQAFMDAFSKLPQKVICKWETKIPNNIPSNILLVDWLPQQDLLGIGDFFLK
jgi:glucuronosyltransferase